MVVKTPDPTVVGTVTGMRVDEVEVEWYTHGVYLHEAAALRVVSPQQETWLKLKRGAVL